jgi:hypothetical protein
MNTQKSIHFGLLAIAVGMTTWGAWHAIFFEPATAHYKIEDNTMNQLKIFGPTDTLDPRELPSVVPMTNEQTAYVMAVTEMAIRVIQKRTALEEAEKTLFGEGKYHYPKAPGPVKSKIFDENFRIRGVKFVFNRIDEKSVWNSAGLWFRTRNSSESAYQMNLPSSFFDGMILDKAVTEERPAYEVTPAYIVHIFQFHTFSDGVKVQLKFETREDLSSLKDKYPQSFHFLEIARID